VIDAEVRLLMDGAAREAADALRTNKKVLDILAAELLEKETLLQEDLVAIFKAVKKVPERTVWDSGHPKATRAKRA
jgi:cell division protease FtsH